MKLPHAKKLNSRSANWSFLTLCVLVLCGAGSMAINGYLQSALDGRGQNINNVSTLNATNVVAYASVSSPAYSGTGTNAFAGVSDPRFPATVTGIRKGNGASPDTAAVVADMVALLNGGSGTMNLTGYTLSFGNTTAGTINGTTIPSSATLVVLPATVTVADAAATLSFAGPTWVTPTAALTAARTLTLPAASTVTKGTQIRFLDIGGFLVNNNGSVGGSGSAYTIARAGSDTINGATSVLWGPGIYTSIVLESDGVSKWIFSNPNSVAASQGGNFGFRPTLHAPFDRATGFGYTDATSGSNHNFISAGNVVSFISSSGEYNGRIFPTSYATAYASGGYGGNSLGLKLVAGTGTSGLNYASGDNYFRILENGYSALSIYMPTTGTANTVGYFGDIVTPAATTSWGVGKAPSVVGLDVAGTLQSDTALVLSGTATASIGGTLTVGGGTTLKKFLSATASLSYGAITTFSESTQTVTVTGATASLNPSVELGWSAALPAGIVVKQSWVSADNTVSITLLNATVGTVTPSAITCRATVEQF